MQTTLCSKSKNEIQNEFPAEGEEARTERKRLKKKKKARGQENEERILNMEGDGKSESRADERGGP